MAWLPAALEEPGAALVLYGDEGSSDDHVLSVKQGDVVKVLSEHDGGWLYCERVRRGTTPRQDALPHFRESVDAQPPPRDAEEGEDDRRTEADDAQAETGDRGYVSATHLAGHAAVMDWQDDEYFDSYAHLKLHKEMLADGARNKGYMEGITCARDFLRNKTAMDVGCGTGLLAMMMIRDGEAELVHAVEASQMAENAKEVVQANGYNGRVHVHHTNVGKLELGEQVDAIVSEWMGTLLIFEFMIDSVLLARDRYLRPGGLMLPAQADLFMIPVEAAATYADYIDFWKERASFDLSPLIPASKTSFLARPLHDWNMNDSGGVELGPRRRLFAFNMHTLAREDLEVLEASLDLAMHTSGQLHGLASWFDVGFAPAPDKPATSVLSTGPGAALTHWKQDLFLFDEPIDVREGSTLKGTITLVRNPVHRRHLRAHFRLEIDGRSVHKQFFLWQ